MLVTCLYTYLFRKVLLETEVELQQAAGHEMGLDLHLLALRVHTFDHAQLKKIQYLVEKKKYFCKKKYRSLKKRNNY